MAQAKIDKIIRENAEWRQDVASGRTTKGLDDWKAENSRTEVVLTLSKDEAQHLADLLGTVSGIGPARTRNSNISRALNNAGFYCPGFDGTFGSRSIGIVNCQ